MENRINSLMYKGFETGFFIGFRIYDVKAHISRYKTLARDIVCQQHKIRRSRGPTRATKLI